MSILNEINKRISRVLQAIDEYPMAVLGALVFTLVTMMRIQIDLEGAESTFLFDCIQMSLAAFIIFAMFSRVFFKSSKKSITYSYVINLFILIIAFIGLYYYSKGLAPAYSRISVTDIARARLVVWIWVCMIGYMIYSKRGTFSASMFLFIKSLAIALLYGLVLMAGTTGIAGAVQGLLYNDMSEKVYMHLSAMVGFATYLIFLGSFPKINAADYMDKARKPKAIEVLLVYIMIPIILTLSLVLLLWMGKAVLFGDWPAFNTVMGIITSYLVFGIWLYILLKDQEKKLSLVFKKLFPWITSVILIFGVWSFIKYLVDEPFRNQAYFFLLLMVFAVLVMLLMFVKKDQSVETIPILLIVFIIISVLPLIGYHQLPAALEVHRLEALLIDKAILVNDQIIASDDIDLDTRIEITESVHYLSMSRDFKLPIWFERNFSTYDIFEERFGFEMTWSDRARINNEYTYLHLKEGIQDISQYDYAVYMVEDDTSFKTSSHAYNFIWTRDKLNLKVYKEGELILDEDMSEFFYGLRNETSSDSQVMSYQIKNDELDLVIVFKYIRLTYGDQMDIQSEVKVVYLKE